MSGHSHWSSIKHKKAVVDARRGKVFSKVSKALTVAAREGGGDPSMNLSLRAAIEKAKALNMPKDNIEKAIKKGTGELEGVRLEATIYEGYAPGGVAVLAQALTDNRNRTASEVRKLFSANGGNLGESNCVAWLFDSKGLVTLGREGVNEEALLETVLEAGADSLDPTSDGYEITCDPKVFQQVKEELLNKGYQLQVAEVTMVPRNYVDLEVSAARRVLNLLGQLEDHEDVQEVYANCNLPEELR